MPNPICDICHRPVKLETSKTNELGKVVHERCYLLRVMSKNATSESAQSLATALLFSSLLN